MFVLLLNSNPKCFQHSDFLFKLLSLTTRHSLHFISLISIFATHKLFVNWEKKLTISRSPSRYNSAAGAAAVQPVSQPERRRILAWLRSLTASKFSLVCFYKSIKVSFLEIVFKIDICCFIQYTSWRV